MVYTVTFNPSIDYVVNVDNIRLGRVNRCQNEYVLYGGKGINVSMVLNNLGVKSKALGFVAGFTGNEIENGVKCLGIDSDFIHVNNGMSRINVKIKSCDNNEKYIETEINGQGPMISQDDINNLYDKIDELIDGDYLVLAGSIPNTVSNNIYEKIMNYIKDKNINVVVDATKDLLINVLKHNPFLIKPNNYELGEMFGVECYKEEDIIKYASILQDKGARNVLVSMGKDGAILIAETKEIYTIKAPKGKVVNSVGAGDSMVAGFIADYIKNQDYKSALIYGTAAGSATAFSEGLAVQTKVDELLDQME